MNLPCPVVRDLLPVYAEKLVESETQMLVEQHLAVCPECMQKRKELGSDESRPVETVRTLQSLKNQIRRRRWRAAAMSALCVFIILFVSVYRADSMYPLAWEQGLVEVKGVETITPDERAGRQFQLLSGEDELPAPHEYAGEALVLHVNSRIVGTDSTTIIEEDGTRTVLLQGMGRRSQRLPNTFEEYGEMFFYPVPDRVIYGYSTPQELLWGKALNGGVEVLPRLTLNYYLLIAAALTGLSGLLWMIFCQKRYSGVMRQLFLAPCTYLLAHLLLKGTETLTFFLVADFCCILLVAAALYALLSLGWQVWKQQQKEKQN